MITRSKARKARKIEEEANVHSPTTVKEVLPKEVYDISQLNKESLFNLLLMVEPHEIGVVCYSKNPRVREICSSGLFQEAYKRRHPKKLMIGKVKGGPFNDDDRFYDEHLSSYFSTKDEKGNYLFIGMDEDKKIKRITYKPFKQMYPSTFKTTRNQNAVYELTENRLSVENPMEISFYKFKDGYQMKIGRPEYFFVTDQLMEDFLSRYPLEVKEFLKFIERERWWNDGIVSPDENFASREAMIDFVDEVYKILENIKITYNQTWTVLKPKI